jgi:hypothetical protein
MSAAYDFIILLSILSRLNNSLFYYTMVDAGII